MDPELAKILGIDIAPHGSDVHHEEDRATGYRRILFLLAKLLSERLHADHAEVYCAGFSVGAFELVASFPKAMEGNEDEARITVGATDLRTTAIAHLVRKNPFAVSCDSNSQLLDFSKSGDELTLWFYGRGEFFGFAVFRRKTALEPSGITYLKANLERIQTFVADENFAFRLDLLLNPVERGEIDSGPQETFFKSITDNAARAFGADGAIVRTLDSELLVVRAASGASMPGLMSTNVIGESISGAVFAHEADGWAALQLDDAAYDRGNVTIPEKDRAEIKSLGVRAMVECKIGKHDSRVSEDGKSGTLCYFFLRPHLFSRRDIDLFRAYCNRVSDYLELIHALINERGRAELQELQARRLTYVEIANLLAHDLWHKSFNASSAADSTLEYIERAIKQNKLRAQETVLEELSKNAAEAQTAANTLYTTSTKLRAIQTNSPDEMYNRIDFTLDEALEIVESTLRPVMARNKISLARNGPGGVHLHGPKALFEQVLFNLFINSIDAARMRSRTRPMQIALNWHVSNSRLIVRYGDDGPGIDPIVFPKAHEIFEIGRSSKRDGTGTGLPIARQLIGSQFRGNLRLDERQPVLFTLDVPLERT